MNEAELHIILARGEDSHHQFKRDFTNVDTLAAELIAFANSVGGRLFIGVTDDGKVSGLTTADVARLNQLLSKRHVTAREEMQRLFQQSALVYADEVPAKTATIADLNQRELEEYFQRRYRKSVESTGLALPKLLQNLNLKMSLKSYWLTHWCIVTTSSARRYAY